MKSIQDDIEKGYVRKLSDEEVCTDSKVTWYLPYRFVINSKKPDRLRRVYDASAKIRGQSLNDKMYTGQITCRCLVFCFDFAKEELRSLQTC